MNCSGSYATIIPMTKLMKRALEALSDLPDDRQDEIARVILNLTVQNEEPEAIPAEDLPAVLQGLAEAERGEFATQAEVEKAFRRFDG